MDILTLTQLFQTANCSGNGCPAIYDTGRDTLAVQGWQLPSNGGIDIPAGEGIVEIPGDVEDAIGERWARRQGLI